MAAGQEVPNLGTGADEQAAGTLRGGMGQPRQGRDPCGAADLAVG